MFIKDPTKERYNFKEQEERIMNKRLPQSCKSGDRVAIIAPSSPFQKKWLDEGCNILRSWGLEPIYEQTIFDEWGYLSGRDEVRSKALIDAFFDPDIKAILSARGGYGSLRLVEGLPYEQLSKHKKRFFGFSDITLLHQVFEQKSNFISFHAPMIASQIFIEGTSESQERLKKALFADTIEEIAPPITAKPLQKGRGKGRLIGGNLSLIISSIGTPWQLNAKGAILFIEDVSEPPYRIDRMIQQLRYTGVLEQISGLILGDFGSLKDRFQQYDPRDFWQERLKLPKELPIVYDFPCGHIRDNYTMPIGANAEINGNSGVVSFS